MDKLFALDTETVGLYGRILGFSTCSAEHDAAAWEATPANLALLKRKINQGWIPVFWNAAYDLQILEDNGILVPRYYDAMLADYNLNPTHASYSLEEAAIRYELTTSKVKMERFTEWNELLESRARTDARMTWDIWQIVSPQLKQDPRAWDWYEQWDNEYARVVQEMQSTGLYLDTKEVTRLTKHLEVKKTKLEQWFIKHKYYYLVPESGDGLLVEYKNQVSFNGELSYQPYEVKVPIDYVLTDKEQLQRQNTKTKWIQRTDWVFVPGTVTQTVGHHQGVYDHCDLPLFNPGSGTHVADALMRLGWIPSKLTKTKKPSTTNEVLDGLDYPIARVIITLAGVNKMLKTFLSKLTPEPDGFLRTGFGQTTTVTGRLSSFANERGGMNFQNIPARGNYGKQIRSMVISPPGYSIVDIDLSNIELRVLAHYLSKYCGDDRMVEAFVSGANIHDANAKLWELPRPDAKIAIFALLYGAWDEKLGKGDKARGAAIRATIDDKMPAIQELKEKVWKSCADHDGWFHTELGFRLYYPNIIWDNAYVEALNETDTSKAARRLAGFKVERAKRQVFNAALQGTAANILKVLQIKSRPVKKQLGASHAVSVHDESLYYILDSTAPQLAAALDKQYQSDLLSHCPIKGDCKIGKTWREVH